MNSFVREIEKALGKKKIVVKVIKGRSHRYWVSCIYGAMNDRVEGLRRAYTWVVQRKTSN